MLIVNYEMKWVRTLPYETILTTHATVISAGPVMAQSNTIALKRALLLFMSEEPGE